MSTLTPPSTEANTRPKMNRSRSQSIKIALDSIPLNEQRGEGSPPTSPPDSPPTSELPPTLNPSLHLNGSPAAYKHAQSLPLTSLRKRSPSPSPASQAIGKAQANEVKALRAPVVMGKDGKKHRQIRRKGVDEGELYRSRGIWNDWKTGRWMLIPSSSLPILLIPIALFLTQHLLSLPTALAPALGLPRDTLIPAEWPNVWAWLLTVQHALPGGGFDRGWKDFLFVAYHIVAFSFIRQSITLYMLRPLARTLGIKGGKIERFTEQGYAVCYFGFFGSLGVYVMSGLPIWWYHTPAMWTTFPVIRMPYLLKSYYLWQFSYWLQQAILLGARVEKPRKDFKELVAHHFVTLWLVGWSYYLTLTYIGVLIFVTMDVSDIFLALAKCVNYVSEKWSAPVFAFFVGVWSYMRHYLNLKILWSVWYEWRLIPEAERTALNVEQNKLMAPWIQYQIFIPIFALQLINLFWYFLIWRILIRAIFSAPLADERSEDEASGGETDIEFTE